MRVDKGDSNGFLIHSEALPSAFYLLSDEYFLFFLFGFGTLLMLMATAVMGDVSTLLMLGLPSVTLFYLMFLRPALSLGHYVKEIGMYQVKGGELITFDRNGNVKERIKYNKNQIKLYDRGDTFDIRVANPLSDLIGNFDFSFKANTHHLYICHVKSGREIVNRIKGTTTDS
ncbi:hypothetical protein KUV56_04215 [Ferrimonas balearica]|uniref:hypothetical protein n=1 Tax=Ferrimonas balearica TaxID=44012 RepID=UPI001C594029|nr:hypothetical protein [Ferrimonas balearica]MBW3138734.1 hypothetical protein [Ferrimonas balearica]